MNYTIKNDKLTVEISSRGAELQSIKSKDGAEYLWQGDARYWSDRATNIFPYVARLTNETYSYRGKEYRMKIHGFLSDSELAAEQKSDSGITFRLESNDKTRAQYPFEFTYEIKYRLEGKKIFITLRVINRGDRTMYFGLGGHPGFNVPLGADGKFEDYFLEFSELSEPYRIGMTDTCFVTGVDEPFELRGGRYLDLRHDMFDDDAIILRDMCRNVTLKSGNSGRSVTVDFPSFDYLGIWHRPKTDAGYVCIEPWSSLPARDGVIEDIEKQENLVSLEAGETYENSWSIEIN